MKITHLSVVVKNPKLSCQILAEMTQGRAEEFKSKNMSGDWVCMWGNDTDELVEFLPHGYLMHPTALGANFKKIETPLGYNSTHFQLEISIALEEIKTVADKYQLHHYFRPRFGGPLYEVWIEDQFLVEFVSDEIRALAASVSN